MNFAPLAMLPAAVALDRLLGEPPLRIHPVRAMGALATRIETRLRHEKHTKGNLLAGILACLLVILPCAILAGGITLAAGICAGSWGEWLAGTTLIYFCIAPRSLAEHATRVAKPLSVGDLEKARKAVAMMVGRDTNRLDAHGVARACVESVAENLTDGVLGTLFWAGAGMIIFGCAGAAALAAAHRAANILDALWGKKDAVYARFGTCAARLDDMFNFLPARLSLPCIFCASLAVPGLRHKNILRVGWKYRGAHESPNSAWGEAAFAGALDLRLGGPATYGTELIRHPTIGDGNAAALPRHISLAVRLMWLSVIVFTAFELLVLAALGQMTGL